MSSCDFPFLFFLKPSPSGQGELAKRTVNLLPQLSQVVVLAFFCKLSFSSMCDSMVM